MAPYLQETHCNILATHCNTLQHTAMQISHWNTRKGCVSLESAADCTLITRKTLQHTAIHCNTLHCRFHAAIVGTLSYEIIEASALQYRLVVSFSYLHRHCILPPLPSKSCFPGRSTRALLVNSTRRYIYTRTQSHDWQSVADHEHTSRLPISPCVKKHRAGPSSSPGCTLPCPAFEAASIMILRLFKYFPKPSLFCIYTHTHIHVPAVV